jgi:hypothetical protein
VKRDSWRNMENLRSIGFDEALCHLQGMLGLEVKVTVNDYAHFFGCGFEGALERVQTLRRDCLNESGLRQTWSGSLAALGLRVGSGLSRFQFAHSSPLAKVVEALYRATNLPFPDALQNAQPSEAFDVVGDCGEIHGTSEGLVQLGR